MMFLRTRHQLTRALPKPMTPILHQRRTIAGFRRAYKPSETQQRDHLFLKKLATGRDNITVLREEIRRLNEEAAVLAMDGADVSNRELNHNIRHALRVHLLEMERAETERLEEEEETKRANLVTVAGAGFLTAIGIMMLAYRFRERESGRRNDMIMKATDYFN